MTEARRTLDWEKQLALSIDPEKAALIHGVQVNILAIMYHVPCVVVLVCISCYQNSVVMKKKKKNYSNLVSIFSNSGTVS